MSSKRLLICLIHHYCKNKDFGITIKYNFLSSMDRIVFWYMFNEDRRFNETVKQKQARKKEKNNDEMKPIEDISFLRRLNNIWNIQGQVLEFLIENREF